MTQPQPFPPHPGPTHPTPTGPGRASAPSPDPHLPPDLPHPDSPPSGPRPGGLLRGHDGDGEWWVDLNVHRVGLALAAPASG